MTDDITLVMSRGAASVLLRLINEVDLNDVYDSEDIETDDDYEQLKKDSDEAHVELINKLGND